MYPTTNMHPNTFFHRNIQQPQKKCLSTHSDILQLNHINTSLHRAIFLPCPKPTSKCRLCALKCYKWLISLIWSQLSACWKPRAFELVHDVHHSDLSLNNLSTFLALAKPCFGFSSSPEACPNGSGSKVLC